MTTLQDKLDNIYQTKLEIKSAIGTDSDVFSEYPAMIRSMAGGGVSYSYLDERLSYYVETSDLESMGYITIEDVPQVDLSSYVTYTYLESKEYLTEIPSTYATYAAIEAMGYATESYVTNAIENIPDLNIKQDIIPESNGTYTLGDEGYYYAATYSYELKMHLQNSIHIVNPYTIGVKVYDTDRYKFTNEEFAPFNTNVVNVNLGSNNSRFSYTYTNNLILGNDNIVDLFPTYAAIEGMGYVTSNDLPVINENIIPKENNTYTLGDADHIYNSAYATDLYMSTKNKISNRSDNQINIMLNNGWKYTFHSNGITPVASQNQNLGDSANPWYATYTTYAYTDNLYLGSYSITYLINSMFSYDTSTGTLTITTL